MYFLVEKVGRTPRLEGESPEPLGAASFEQPHNLPFLGLSSPGLLAKD